MSIITFLAIDRFHLILTAIEHEWLVTARKNDLDSIAVVVNGPNTMTKGNLRHILKALLMGHIVKPT